MTHNRLLDTTIPDAAGYLARMEKPLLEKMRVARYLSEGATRALDVGCANGAITKALAASYPRVSFLGIDLNEEFIADAQKNVERGGNVSFERQYLRDLLARDERYDAVFFTSVLHEFFSYGEGISSVVKALADAHELLKEGGDCIIRDMVFAEYTKHNQFSAKTIAAKIRSVETVAVPLADFEKAHGSIDTLYAVNHFLLKYFYTDNWAHECKEHYVPVTIEQYEAIFSLLGMEMIHRETYTLPFLEEKWKADFGFDEIELAALNSTSILVARKV